MFVYNEIKEGKYIIFEGEPYEVLESHVFRKQQRKPVNATKLRNLITGRVAEHSFHVSDKADEAEIDKKDIKFLYENRSEFWFCDIKDASKRFQISGEFLTDRQKKFVKPNSIVTSLSFDEKVFAIQIPIKVTLKVKDAPPGIKGDSSRGGLKQIVLETGATINAPLFIETDEYIEVNTDTGEYVARAEKPTN